MYEIVKRYFDRGIYSVEDVEKFVLAGKLTEEEKETIIAGK